MRQQVICSVLLLATVLSCGDRDITDINKNPLTASRSEPAQALTLVLVRHSNLMISELGIAMNYVVHHTSIERSLGSVANGQIDSYASGNIWNDLYTSSLGNLLLLDAQAQGIGPLNTNVRVIAKTLSARVFFELTCIFGDVPFSEALNATKYLHPKFDAQEQVLDGIVGLLDEAITLADAVPHDALDLSAGDLLLAGDVQRWKEFANSLKIRTLMLIRNVDARKADAEKKLAEAFGKPVIAAPIQFLYPGGARGRNAYYNLVANYGNEESREYGPSPTLRDMLVNSKDPRLKLWLVDLSGTGMYPTATYGQYPNKNQTVFRDDLIRDDYPDIFMLPGELDFYRAELILGGTLAGSAQQAFEDGIRKTIRYWGGEIPGFRGTPVGDKDIDNYIAGLGAVDLKKIHEQLWLESLFRPVVSWNTVRRTGTPALKPPSSAIISAILKRFPIPPAEQQVNPNTPASLELDTPMWFEKQKTP